MLVEDSALLPPTALSPPPPLLFPVTTCKLKTNLPLPPRPAWARPPPRPAPHSGPSCGRPRQSVIPLALLSALGPLDRLSLCHTHPEKLRARWDRTSGVRSSTRGRPGLGKGPTTAPHMAVGGGKGALGGAAREQHGREMTHHGHPGDRDHAGDPCSAAG